MSLADRIRQMREEQQLSLDELALKAKISKTYLWELEKDENGQKKPSADILLKIALALKTTIAELLNQPSIVVNKTNVTLSPSLIELRDWMKETDQPLTEEELKDLATTRFRGGQPKTREDWYDLYRLLKRTTRR